MYLAFCYNKDGLLEPHGMRMIKKNRSIKFGLFFLLLLVGILPTSCDFVFNDNQMISPTSSFFQTISPATLTAISAEADLKKTPLPDPMGIPWSNLDGLEIEFWHVWDLDEHGSGMKYIIDQFNQENGWGITVKSVDQGLFQNPRESVETAFKDGLVPNLMIIDDLPIPGWYEEGYIIDLNPFIEDPAAGFTTTEMKEFYPGLFEEYTLRGGIRPAIPFVQAIQVMYYNQSWGKELGFQTPPENYADVYEQSCASTQNSQDDQDDSNVQSGGLILYPDAASITSWIYAYEGTLLDRESGKYQFTSREFREVGMDWITMLQDGCGLMITGYPNPMAQEIEIDQFNRRGALMIMSSSKNYHLIHMGANTTGRADDWTMIPFVGPDGDKAVTAEVQSSVIFDSNPDEELAAWLFLKYLTSPEIQAEWVQDSYYYPVHKGASRFLNDYRIDNPHWSQGYTLLRYSKANQLHQSWEVIQQAVGDAFEAILLNSPEEMTTLLNQLNQVAAELVSYTEDN